ncbi:hypothetical protein [Deinococcus hopiensis]|uniref:Uncharacterized protein n=1 Tax=Deinococcus hopiensis KR-140 TaxID=695939 RepID=A0A1W1UQ74_9DEIO|nr:hypothetical protein [Deinococcus hopiensis]SMB83216.1 hypothetical protein SAMN00790413_04310 [Deinococcus hopiensis KR-140]
MPGEATCFQQTHHRVNNLCGHADRILREIAEHLERFTAVATPSPPDRSKTQREVERLRARPWWTTSAGCALDRREAHRRVRKAHAFLNAGHDRSR